MMKKDKRKSEYFGASKGLRFMLLMLMTVAMLLCLSACITIQVPDKLVNNKDVKTEEPKKNDAQTEDPGTADVQNSDPSEAPSPSGSQGGSQGSDSGSNNPQKKSQGSTETPKKSQGSTDTPKKSSGSAAAPSDSDKGSGGGGSASGNTGKSGISEAEAINIALKRVKGATKNDIISFKSEYDDGRLEYEGKIKKDGVVYEFEIDGETGNILDWEIDDD